MANINNSNNNTIVRGTDNADTITNTGSNVTISPGSGDDTINLNGSNQVINMLNMSGDNQVYGFDSDDTIFSPYNWYLGFEGDNAIKIDSRLILHNARNKKINLTSGRNGSISSEVAFFNDTMGGKITVDPGIKYFFNASSKATINANGSRVSNIAASVLINGTANNDTISNSGSYVTIDAGDGTDTISNSGSYVTIDVGEGNDVINNDHYVYYGSYSSISGGAGNDTIYNGGSYVTVNGGKSNDVIYLYSRSNSTGSNRVIEYAEGDGNDTIINFGGADILHITNGSISSASVNGVDVSLKVGTGSLLFRNMAGYDFNILDENDSDYETTIIGGLIREGSSNNDTITNSQNDAIIRPGNGNDVISLKGARQIIDYTGGNDTVYGLDPDDFIRLGGRYPLAMSVQGSDVIFTTNYRYSQSDVVNSLTLKNVAGKKFNAITADGYTLFVPSTGATVDNTSGFLNIKNVFNGVLIDAGNGDNSIYTTGDNVTIRAEGTITRTDGYGTTFIDGYGKNISVKTSDGDEQIDFYSEGSPSRNITVDAGGGNNHVNIDSRFETNDIVQVGKNIKLKAGNGEDYFDIYGADSVSIDAGDGTNYIYISGYGTNSDLTIKSGAGNDEIYAYDYNNRTINAGAGSNTIYAGSNDKKTFLKNTSVKTGDGDDFISVNQTNNVSIESSGGNNLISLNSVYDIYDLENLSIKTGAGDDRIYESGYDSVTIDTGDGNDSIEMYKGDWIYDETLKTDRPILGKNIKVNAGAGDDYVDICGIENGTVEGGAGNDYIQLYDVKNVLINAGIGDDYIQVDGFDGTTGDISIDAGSGNDTIYVSYMENVSVAAGDGNDEIWLYELKNSTLKSGKGNDLFGGFDSIRNVLMDFGDGNDTVDGSEMQNSENVTLVGGDGDKNIKFYADNMSIKTGAGKDTFDLGGEHITLDSGAGDDSILSNGEHITLDSGAGDDSIRNNGDHIVINAGDGNDVVRNDGDFSTINAGDGNDTIYNNDFHKVIDGGAGNDIIYNNDTEESSINGGAGNDSISGYYYYSTIDGGDGNDSLVSEYGAFVLLRGGAGNDSIQVWDPNYNDYTFTTVNGGNGNDNVTVKGEGSFIYQYAVGDGNDSIQGNGMPIIQLTSGSVSDVSFSNEKYLVKVGSETITVEFNGKPLIIRDVDGNTVAWYINSHNQLFKSDDTLVSGDGELFNFRSNVTLEGDDNLTNFGSNVVINNFNQEHAVKNLFGSNVTINAIGNVSNSGSKVTINTPGDVDGSDVIREIRNDGSDVIIKGSGYITNTGSNVTINANADGGWIGLYGSNEVFVYGKGAGDYGIEGFDETNEIRIEGDYSIDADTSSHVEILVDGKSIYLNNIDVETVTIHDINYVVTADTLTSGIEYDPKKPSRLVVKDPFSGVVDAAKISDKITQIDASASTKPTVLKGGAKANVINAGSGASTLVGGAKDDKLYGGTGKNTFVYTVGNGKDAISDYEAQDVVSIVGATRDKLLFADKNDVVTVTFDGDNKSKLTVDKVISSDTLTFRIGEETYTYGELPKGVTFDDNAKKTALKIGATAADGVIVDAADIVSTAKTIDGSNASGAVYLIGNDNANVLRAGAHGSTLYGGSSTKAVADKLYGGSGQDVFMYTAGDGADVIYSLNGAQNDYVVVNGVTSIDASKASWSGNKLTVTIDKQKLTFDDPQGAVKIVDGNGKELYKTGINLPSGVSYNAKKTAVMVENAAEVDVIDLTSGYNSTVKEVDASKYAGAINIVGNDNANVLRAGGGGSTLNGGLGADKLYGGAGQDVFMYTAGDGADVIYSLNGAQNDYVMVNGVTSIDASKASWSGNKLTVTIDKQKLTFDDPQGAVRIVDGNGKELYKTGINLPSGVSYNAKKTAVAVESAAEVDTIDLTSGYNSTVKEVDASKYKGTINIVGNANANVLRAGEGNATINGGYDTAKKKVTADKLYGSTTTGASDVFVWDAIWGGGDQIYNYSAAAGDVISITGGGSTLTVDSSDFKISGNKVVMSAGTGKLTINDLTSSKTVKVIYGGDKEFVYASLPSGVTYDDKTNNKAMKIAGDFEGTLDVTTEDYLGTVVTLDASGSSNAIELIGNKKAKMFIGGTNETTMVGSAAADVFNCGGGSDVIVYSVGGGKDQIYNFDSSTDVIRLFGATVAATDFTEKGKDITLTIDKGSITLKDAPRGVINVVNGDGSTVAYKTLPTGITYNAKKELVTATKDFKGTLNAGDLGGPVKEINAAATTDAVTLQGAASTATKITAGKGGSSILGGTGADTMIGGKGVDIFAAGNGADLITNYTAGQDKIQIVGALTAGKVNGSNVELTTSAGSITLKGVVGKELTVNVDGADAKYKFTKTNNTLDKALVGGSAAELAADVDNYWFTRSDGAVDEIGALLDMTATADEAALALKSFDLDSPSMHKTLPTIINAPRKQKTLR